MNTKTLNKENGIFMGVNPVGGNEIFDEGLAKAILSYLKKQNVKKIADFGCGHGQYTFFFEKENLKCDGFDGNPDTPKITKNKCKVLDLTKKFVSETKWEYIISLEVGEHLPKKFEKIFIQNLDDNNTKGIILSWALDGQGGYGHFNERNNDYIKNISDILIINITYLIWAIFKCTHIRSTTIVINYILISIII